VAIDWRLIARVPRVRRRGVAALARRRPTSSPARPGSSSRRSDRGAQTHCSEMRPQAALRGLAAGGGSLHCFGSHRIRHATATLLVNNGMPLEEVSRYLGHSSTMPTRRYAQQTPEALGERAASALSRAGLVAADGGSPHGLPPRPRTGAGRADTMKPHRGGPLEGPDGLALIDGDVSTEGPQFGRNSWDQLLGRLLCSQSNTARCRGPGLKREPRHETGREGRAT
jgi:hypothetical protein